MIVRRALFNNAGPFLSEWEVEIPEGVTAIVGEYDDATSRSNRAGKSFLAVDGLLYALFGTFRGRTDDFVHRLARGREDGFVEYDLESSEGRTWTLRRGRTRSGAPIREVDGDPVKDDELAELVRGEILGLSLEELTLTNCFVQGRMHQFMEMTPAEKRRVVSPWFRTDRWVPRADLARARLAAARRRLSGLEAAIEEDRGFNAAADAVDVGPRLEREESRLATARAEVERVLEERAAVLARVEAAAERAVERKRLDSAVTAAVLAYEVASSELERALNVAAARLRSARADVAAASARVDRIADLERQAADVDGIREETAKLREELASLRAKREAEVERRDDLRRVYRTLTRERTGVCPILAEPCERVEPDAEHAERTRTSGLRATRAIERAGTGIKRIEHRLDMLRMDLGGALEAARDLENLRGEVSVAQAEHEFELATAARTRAEEELARHSRGKTDSGRALAAARRAARELFKDAEDDGPTRELARIAEERDAAEGERDAAEREVSRLRSLAETVARNERRIAEREAEREVVRREIEFLAWAAYAFGAAGIPSRELENAFGVAEDAMNVVLRDLAAPTRLRFAPTRELKDWEPACLACGEPFEKGERKHVCPVCGVPRRRRRRDELRLEVLDGANESAFELDSGGGKVLLSLGVRFGLATLPATSRRVRCETAVVDEPDGALDAPNRAALHALLRGRLPALGLRQALLITHADVREEFESVVVVRRYEGEDRSGFWRE